MPPAHNRATVPQGFPGTVRLAVTYTLTPGSELWVEMSATTGAWVGLVGVGDLVGLEGGLPRILQANSCWPARRMHAPDLCACSTLPTRPQTRPRRSTWRSTREGACLPLCPELAWKPQLVCRGGPSDAAVHPRCPSCVPLSQTSPPPRPLPHPCKPPATSTWAATPAAPSWATPSPCTAGTTTRRCARAAGRRGRRGGRGGVGRGSTPRLLPASCRAHLPVLSLTASSTARPHQPRPAPAPSAPRWTTSPSPPARWPPCAAAPSTSRARTPSGSASTTCRVGGWQPGGRVGGALGVLAPAGGS